MDFDRMENFILIVFLIACDVRVFGAPVYYGLRLLLVAF